MSLVKGRSTGKLYTKCLKRKKVEHRYITKLLEIAFTCFNVPLILNYRKGIFLLLVYASVSKYLQSIVA